MPSGFITFFWPFNQWMINGAHICFWPELEGPACLISSSMLSRNVIEKYIFSNFVCLILPVTLILMGLQPLVVTAYRHRSTPPTHPDICHFLAMLTDPFLQPSPVLWSAILKLQQSRSRTAVFDCAGGAFGLSLECFFLICPSSLPRGVKCPSVFVDNFFL